VVVLAVAVAVAVGVVVLLVPLPLTFPSVVCVLVPDTEHIADADVVLPERSLLSVLPTESPLLLAVKFGGVADVAEESIAPGVIVLLL
jgi:hypothetical protein